MKSRSSAVQAHYARVGEDGWRMNAETKMKRLGMALGAVVALIALSGCVVDRGYYRAGYGYNGGYGYNRGGNGYNSGYGYGNGQSYGRSYGGYNRGYDRDRDDYDRR
jgi:hypothetical protein